MTVDPRSFHIGDILTVTTGKLVSPSHIGGLYEILNFMTGDSLFTHQLPRASDDCRPSLLRQHPDLAAVDVPDSVRDETTLDEWLTTITQEFGEFRLVYPLAPMSYTSIDPLAELDSMTSKPVIVVEVDDE